MPKKPALRPSPLPRPRLAVLLVVAFAAGGLAAQVSVRPRSIDFGERGHGEAPTTRLRITNSGATDLAVASMKRSCSCITLRPATLDRPIGPGQSAEIEVSMASGRAMGSLHKSVDLQLVNAAGASRKLRVPVQMSVFDGYALEPRELRFVAVYGKSATAAVELLGPKGGDGRRDVKVRVDKVVAGQRTTKDYGKLFTSAVTPIEGGRRIELTLSPKHPEGRVWGELRAYVDGRPFRVPVVGDVFRGILLEPKQFNFNRVDAADADTFVERSTLRSTDDRPFRILSMEARVTRPSGAGFRIVLAEEAKNDGREHVITARLSSRQPLPSRGTFSGRVVVRTDHPDKESVGLAFFGFFAGKLR